MAANDSDRQILEMVADSVKSLDGKVDRRFSVLEEKFDTLGGQLSFNTTDIAVLKTFSHSPGTCATMVEHKSDHREIVKESAISNRWKVGILVSILLSLAALVIKAFA